MLFRWLERNEEGRPKRRAQSGARAHRALMLLVLLVVCGALAGCTTSPLGRRQLKIHSGGEMSRMGIASFDAVKQQLPPSTDAQKNRYVECVANAVLAAVVSKNAPASWEVVVFDEASANAFALPGGKIGVHTGLLDVATNADQLATVLGHEVGHVLAGHANERITQAELTRFGLAVADVAVHSGDPTPGQRKALALLGLGAHFGITLPYSRTHESEADLIGLDIMARAGFEPRESVVLWQNMSRGGARPPEILSTHPSNTTRIRELQNSIPSAEALRDQAHAAGRRPHCGAP